MVYENNVKSENRTLLEKVKEEKRLGMHSFHRYYGKLIPAIPRAFIKKFTNEGDLVFDPFSGSGTTALEAKYADRNFLGIEINPLSALICRVKTENYDIEILKQYFDLIIKNFKSDNSKVSENEKPFCVNRDHWFKDFVQVDLIKLSRSISLSAEQLSISNEPKYKDFFECVVSAIIKQVSNADTMHVFPGISKRMKRLEAENKIHIDVIETFSRAAKKRIGYVEELKNHLIIPKFICGDSSKVDLSQYKDSVDLIVTNPPYISSVRYAETLKLELYWMGICRNQADYKKLSTEMIGNDHISASKCSEIKLTGYKNIDELIKIMFTIDKKQAMVIHDFFTSMEKVILNIKPILKVGKYYVMKISDSKIRKIKVPTGKLLTDIAEANGFELIDMFNDKINENSRSLLTTRNTYSDIILEDNIVIWKRVE